MSTPRRAGLRLVPVALSTWTVALLTITLPNTSGPMAVVLWIATLGALFALGRGPRSRRGVRHAAVILALALAAAAAAASHVSLAQPAREAAGAFALGGGRAVVIDAMVTGKIERRADGQWEFDAVANRVVTGPVSAPVRLEVSIRVSPSEVDRPETLDVGSAIRASGTARAGPTGDRSVLSISASRGVVVRAAPQGLLAGASDLRRDLVDATSGLPEPGAGLIAGLAVGDTSAVSTELDAAMKQSSLSHLTAVSGANCAIVVGLAFGGIALLGGSRRARVAGGVCALIGFILLVTPEPSVVRAGAMAAIAMLGVLLGRSGAGVGLLSLAVAVLLVADPWLAGSLGFALSTVATASLLMCARPLALGLSRWMPRALALAISVPLAAQLACGPLLVVIAPTVPLYGVVANLLAAPAAPLATIIGLAACIAGPLPWVQSGLTAITWIPAAWIAGVAQTFSGLPGDQVRWLEGWPGVAALAVVSVAVGVVLAIPRSPTRPEAVRRLRPWSTRRSLVRLLAGVVVAVTAGVVAGGAALAGVAGRWTLPDRWSVIACDVGQGDAVIVRSAGAIALIDTGPDPDALEGCLSRVGVAHIDLLVLTHFDLDHVGGLEAVLDRVSSVLHGPATTPAAARILAAIERSGTRTVAARRDLTGTLGAAEWRVLWPPPRSMAFPAGNDASVVLDVRGGGVPTSLFLGDLSASPQAALAESGALRPPYDLVKVAHHGSADQDPRLYEQARPGVALVTVGAENTYGHPRHETLDLLEDDGVRIARTDRHGLVALWDAGAEVLVWRERPEGDVAGAG